MARKPATMPMMKAASQMSMIHPPRDAAAA
jgi:hypothetical protein